MSDNFDCAAYRTLTDEHYSLTLGYQSALRSQSDIDDYGYDRNGHGVMPGEIEMFERELAQTAANLEALGDCPDWCTEVP